MDFRYLKYCVVDLKETKRCAVNITVNIGSIHSQEKQSRNENNKKENFQVNTYNKSESNKIVDTNASKKKESMSKQTETRAANKAGYSYPQNPT